MFREEGEAEREKLVELLLTVMLATLDVVKTPNIEPLA